ncbi:MAG TPA: type II and III secretion system protein [Candidatus Baltobacteraceae bacterium]|nr:type II and III secretion system protein [Candidatus Baltobacteraceae bacterium]
MAGARRFLVPGSIVLAAALAVPGGAVGAGTRAPRFDFTAQNEPAQQAFVRLGRVAHLNVTVGPDVQGNVNVALTHVTAAEALHAMCGQLRLRCRSDGRVVAVSMQSSAVVTTQLVPAQRVANVVQRLFPQLSVAQGGGNTLVLAGSDADIAAARTVITGLDVRDPRRPGTAILNVKSQPAGTVAERLRPLFPSARFVVVSKNAILASAAPSDLQEIQSAVSGLEAASPQPSAIPTASEAVHVVQRPPKDIARSVALQMPHVRVGVSGSDVTVAGAADDVQRAKQLIAELDQPPLGERYTQIYHLRNVDASSVNDLIVRAFPHASTSVDVALNAISVTATAVEQQRIADGIAQLDGTSRGPGPGGVPGEEGGGAQPSDHAVVRLRSIVPGFLGAAGTTSASDIASAVQSALAPAHPDLRITAPNGLQELILTGSAPAIRDAKDLIAQLDAIPPSIVLDTEILEVDESSSHDVGLELGSTSIGSTFSETTPPTQANGQPGRLIGFQAITRTPLTLQATLNLLIQNGHARVLANPRITTLSGRTASIRAGDTISILTTVGSGIGTVPSTQLQSFQTGVTLDITPIVTDPTDVSVALHPVVNSLTGYLNGVPQISTRDTQTTVQLRDNETLVIGGLIEENVQANESKIPLLGSLPLVGPLFRDNNKTYTRNELVMVVTPHLVREGEGVNTPARPPGAEIPSPVPLPTVAAGYIFPAARETPRPVPPQLRARTTPAPGPSGSPSASASPAALPSALAAANTYVYGSIPSNTYAGQSDAPQIFYATLSPTVLSPTSTIKISAITTTNVQKLTLSTGLATLPLTPVGTGTWQGQFGANLLGLPSSGAMMRVSLVAARSDGQSASIPITLSIVRSSTSNDVQL